jgi:tRNA-specific 2-thiouridylase
MGTERIAILKESGLDLIGFSMQLWDRKRSGFIGSESGSGRCCSLGDLHDAREVAARLKIPFHVVDFQKEFENTVVKAFVENYRIGLTPSPCVLCNSLVKFSHMVQLAGKVHADRVATGHYARVCRDEESGRYLLLEARDKNKDQSYFLFELSQLQLAKATFPLGVLDKEQVRRIARKYGLAVAEKSESQEICFVPDGDYASFVEHHFGEIAGRGDSGTFSSGNIIDAAGRVLGVHRGIHHYTIGQRRGLGIANVSPLYVIEIRPEDNTVVVGDRSQLDKQHCRVVRPNWISIPSLTEPIRVRAKIRSRHTAASAVIRPVESGSVEVIFDSAQPAITPGQACVFYQDETVVGGGWIARNYE